MINLNFEKKEIKDIIISSISICLMFLAKDWLNINPKYLINLGMNFIIVIFVLFVRLIVQKKVAKKYDCKVEYSFNYALFLIGVVLAVLTPTYSILMPIAGTITISSALYARLGHKFVNITTNEKGKIALFGSFVNIVLVFIAVLLKPLNLVFFEQFIKINLLMALFNMLPFPLLDGEKVIWWNRLVWLIALLIPLFLLFFSYNLIFSLIGVLLISIITFIFWEKMF